MKLSKLIKSKTIDFNVLVPAIAGLLNALGFSVPPEVIAGVLAIGNFILRFFTNKPLSEK